MKYEQHWLNLPDKWHYNLHSRGACHHQHEIEQNCCNCIYIWQLWFTNTV